jgi:hypothetical protein
LARLRQALDGWAADVNQAIADNLRTYNAELLAYAEDRGLLTPEQYKQLKNRGMWETLERWRKLRQLDATWGASKHRVPLAETVALFRTVRPGCRSDWAACRAVAILQGGITPHAVWHRLKKASAF